MATDTTYAPQVEFLSRVIENVGAQNQLAIQLGVLEIGGKSRSIIHPRQHRRKMNDLFQSCDKRDKRDGRLRGINEACETDSAANTFKEVRIGLKSMSSLPFLQEIIGMLLLAVI